MKRRDFITVLGGAVAWPLAAHPQQADRMCAIGILASLPLPPLQRFARKLSEYGYNEGRNLRLISRVYLAGSGGGNSQLLRANSSS
jgi:hypothetical protein